jgi:hypothetical protein
MTLIVIAAAMVFAAGLNYRYIVGALLLRISGGLSRPDKRVVSPQAPAGVLGSVERSAGWRLSDHPVAHRGGCRRDHRPRFLMAGVQKLFYLPEPARISSTP